MVVITNCQMWNLILLKSVITQQLRGVSINFSHGIMTPLSTEYAWRLVRRDALNLPSKHGLSSTILECQSTFRKRFAHLPWCHNTCYGMIGSHTTPCHFPGLAKLSKLAFHDSCLLCSQLYVQLELVVEETSEASNWKPSTFVKNSSSQMVLIFCPVPSSSPRRFCHVIVISFAEAKTDCKIFCGEIRVLSINHSMLLIRYGKG